MTLQSTNTCDATSECCATWRVAIEAWRAIAKDTGMASFESTIEFDQTHELPPWLLRAGTMHMSAAGVCCMPPALTHAASEVEFKAHEPGYLATADGDAVYRSPRFGLAIANGPHQPSRRPDLRSVHARVKHRITQACPTAVHGLGAG